MLKPIRDYLLVKPIKKETLIDIDDVKRGQVVAIGKGKVSNGQIIRLEIEVGDIIRYQYGRKVEDYDLISENDVLVVED